MTPEQAGSFLSVNLGAIADNWRSLQARLGPGKTCAAVLKTDAYGLGAEKIAPALEQAGCKTFFVAHVFEGIALRGVVPAAKIYVLHGVLPGTEHDFVRFNLIPVLNTVAQISDWTAHAKETGNVLAAALHVDTGMTRLGLTRNDVRVLCELPEILDGLAVELVMSHLACGDEPESPMNRRQLASFEAVCAELRKALPYGFQESLSASAGCFLPAAFHKDIARPGIALYGGMGGLKPAVTLTSRMMQVQEVAPGQTIGYGAFGVLPHGGKAATVALGYGDGYPRGMSRRGTAFVGGKKVRVLGRISMDLTVLDVSEVAEKDLFPGQTVEFIGPNCPLSQVAEEAGTIEYEILTNLGRRFYRSYVA